MQLGITYTLENIVDNFLTVDMILKLPQHPKVAIKVRPKALCAFFRLLDETLVFLK